MSVHKIDKDWVEKQIQSNADNPMMWRGVPVAQLSRDELLAIAVALGREYYNSRCSRGVAVLYLSEDLMCKH